MERKIILAIVILVLPFFIWGAENSAVTVSADFSVLDKFSVCFSDERVPATGEIVSPESKSNFKDYSSIKAIKGFPLVIDVNDTERKAVSDKLHFVTWQIYSHVPAQVILKAEGALKTQTTPTEYLNWQISMNEDPSKTAGTLERYDVNSNFNYQDSEIVVFRSNPALPGMSGSRGFLVTTQSLWDKKEADYYGNVIALVRVQ